MEPAFTKQILMYVNVLRVTLGETVNQVRKLFKIILCRKSKTINVYFYKIKHTVAKKGTYYG